MWPQEDILVCLHYGDRTEAASLQAWRGTGFRFCDNQLVMRRTGGVSDGRPAGKSPSLGYIDAAYDTEVPDPKPISIHNITPPINIYVTQVRFMHIFHGHRYRSSRGCSMRRWHP